MWRTVQSQPRSGAVRDDDDDENENDDGDVGHPRTFTFLLVVDRLSSLVSVRSEGLPEIIGLKLNFDRRAISFTDLRTNERTRAISSTSPASCGT